MGKAGIDSLSAFDLSQLDVGFRGFEGADFPGPLDDAPLVWTTEPGSLQLLPDGSAPGAAVETPEDGGADIAVSADCCFCCILCFYADTPCDGHKKAGRFKRDECFEQCKVCQGVLAYRRSKQKFYTSKHRGKKKQGKLKPPQSGKKTRETRKVWSPKELACLAYRCTKRCRTPEQKEKRKKCDKGSSPSLPPLKL